MEEDYQMFKIVVIGSMGTGKTNISTRYIKNQFIENQKSTVGVEFLSKIVQVRNQNIKVTLWDTAGQQRYKSLSKVYYKGASGILIVYDVTDPQSYIDVQSWMRLANDNLNINEVVLMVVGNKIDLQQRRRVPADRALSQYKEKFDIDCYQVSAKTGQNIDTVFTQMLDRIFDLNMKLKGSNIGGVDMDDESYFGSVADGSVVAPVRNMKKQPQQKPVLVNVHQQEKALPSDLVPPKQQIKPPQDKGKMKLTKENTKKDTKKKKSGGCC